MYLHLGQDTVVRLDEIVGIFDMENATISKHTRRFLSDAQKGGRIFNVSMELPKSFVVCMDKKHGRNCLYIADFLLHPAQTHRVHRGYRQHLTQINGKRRQ